MVHDRFFGWELNEFEVKHWKYVALGIALEKNQPVRERVEADSVRHGGGGGGGGGEGPTFQFVYPK